MQDFRLQACVDSVASAIHAEEGGATELELCANLGIGGTTPTLALFEAVKRQTRLPVFVLIRARAGCFVYDGFEREIMIRDAGLLKAAGADGLVAGALTPDGDLDETFLREVVRVADGLPVALHRAFDQCRDADAACRIAETLGLDYILTTGQSDRILENVDLFNRITGAYRVPLMLACSNADNLGVLRARTGIRRYHLSGKTAIESAARHREGADFSSPAQDCFTRYVTDAAKIRAAREALETGCREEAGQSGHRAGKLLR